MKHEDPLDPSPSRRDFTRTPEPRGAKGPGGGTLAFFVQRHDSRHLHFDFRLQLDGVLKSWAVPRGISLDPNVKRLAIHVEDHPLEYGAFEGTIPEGHYGAGSVRLWDRGEWIPEGEPHEALERGELRFILKGERLRGRWSLSRFNPSPDRPEREYWLLRKVRRRAPSRKLPREGGAGKRRPGFPSAVPGALRRPLPGRIEPQLATLVEAAPRGKDWIHEIKLDGYRTLTIVDRGRIRMVSRNDRDWSRRFPALAGELAAIPVQSAVLDGEVVALTSRGTSSLATLERALADGEDRDLFYYVFDLLYLNGWDLRSAPLGARKAALARLLGAARSSPHLRYSEHVRGRGDLFYRHACELQFEGIVSKREDAPHRPGRGGDWVKRKCRRRQEFVIGGFAPPARGRQGIGALLLGTHQGGKFVYVGRVARGVPASELVSLKGRLESLEIPNSPFHDPLSPKDLRGVRWTRPHLVAEVRFSSWSRDRRLRYPVFEGLRRDKAAEGVVLEWPVPAEPELTHPEHLVYPKEGISKREVLSYYEQIAPWILPQVRGRLLSIVRCPEGADQPCFYQKHHSITMPEAIRRIPIDEKTQSAMGLSIDDTDGLRAIVEIGGLELHPWGSRIWDVEHPDRCVFDLDPGPEVPWKEVIRAALDLEQALRREGLESFVKTTGGKGLHLVVPLSGAPDWPALGAFSRRMAESLVRRRPDRYTTSLPKSERAGRILIDIHRNVRGATAVAAYSTRTAPGATVSTPLFWEEVTPWLRPEQFTLKSLPGRIARQSTDPWGGMADLRQELPRLS